VVRMLEIFVVLAVLNVFSAYQRVEDPSRVDIQDVVRHGYVPHRLQVDAWRYVH
jgi:hypothetical protein